MLKQLFHLRLPALLLALIFGGLSALSLLIFTWAPTLYLQRTEPSEGITSASSPLTLRGDAALTHLKEQGLYSSLNEAVKAARFSAQPLPSGKAFQFFNLENGLRATFDAEDRSGTRVAATNNKRQQELAIKFTGYGYDKRFIAFSPHTVNAQQNRVEYTHRPSSEISNPQSAIQEWFVNNPDGIEHGFVLPAPPAVERASDAALRVVMEIGGDFRAQLSAAAQTVSMIDPTGSAELHYDDLHVYDANRRDLPSHFELDGNRLAIVVEDNSAEYPLTIDPLLAQSTRLTAGDGTAEDYFGAAVAISGNTAVVGAPRNDISADADQGAAYMHRPASVQDRRQLNRCREL
jgi:FG-GAP repeat